MENKRLFIDDFEIESKQNLKRGFYPPEKVGTVLQPDRPWEDKSGCACPMVIRDPEGTLKMWYWNSKMISTTFTRPARMACTGRNQSFI